MNDTEQSSGENTPSEVETLQKEVQDLKDKYLRTVAEMENMRRRADRERIDSMKYALEGVMGDLIPVLDSFEKAFPKKTSEDDSVTAGLLMVQRQLLTVLNKHGLQQIESVGSKFDPNHHQAIQKLESAEVQDETVHEEFAKGYSLNGRLIRPAIVAVSIPALNQN